MGSVKKGMLIAMEAYLNNEEYSEFQNIIDDEFIKANKINVDKCVIKTIKLINELSRKLNDDESYEFKKRMIKWYTRGGI